MGDKTFVVTSYLLLCEMLSLGDCAKCNNCKKLVKLSGLMQASPHGDFFWLLLLLLLSLKTKIAGCRFKSKACLHIYDFWLRCRYDSPRFVKSSCTVVYRGDSW